MATQILCKLGRMANSKRTWRLVSCATRLNILAPQYPCQNIACDIFATWLAEHFVVLRATLMQSQSLYNNPSIPASLLFNSKHRAQTAPISSTDIRRFGLHLLRARMIVARHRPLRCPALQNVFPKQSPRSIYLLSLPRAIHPTHEYCYIKNLFVGEPFYIHTAIK